MKDIIPDFSGYPLVMDWDDDEENGAIEDSEQFEETDQQSIGESEAWKERPDEPTDWVLRRAVNRRDTYGVYDHDRDGKNGNASKKESIDEHPRVLIAALEYAQIGYRVVPLGRKGKQPWFDRWTERATRDPEVIIRWFSRMPDSNVGILTGQGLLLLDVDPHNGGAKSFRKLLGRKKLPRTAQAVTGSGGAHYLFRIDPNLKVGCIDGLRPGIDIKGEGGQFVAEPSVHPKTDKEYVWLRTPRQGIADAPQWLLDEILGGNAPKPGMELDCPNTPILLTRDGDAGCLLVLQR